MQKFEYRAPRITVDFPVRFTAHDAATAGRCTEISKEGMRVEFEEPLPPNSRGKVAMSYQDGSLELNVRVAHAGTTHSGLKFICESDEERDAVASLVASLASLQNPSSRHL
jgi:hypothetical protein